MALTRFNGNVVPFASESTTDNRTVFGDVVQADDIDSNLNADFKKGWEIVGLNDNPTKQDFNAMGYTLGALTSYLYQMGIAEYNASQEYKLNAVCIGTDGTIYQSLANANVGNALNDVSKWKVASMISTSTSVVQTVQATLTTSGATTAVIPVDDTIPQSSEGTQILTCAITPTRADSKLLITIHVNMTEDTNVANTFGVAALFRDTEVDAIWAGLNGAQDHASRQGGEIIGSVTVDSVSTAPTTFKLRVGAGASTPYRWNGFAGARLFGGVRPISITIQEII